MCDVMRDVHIDDTELVGHCPLDVVGNSISQPGVMCLQRVIERIRLAGELRPRYEKILSMDDDEGHMNTRGMYLRVMNNE